MHKTRHHLVMWSVVKPVSSWIKPLSKNYCMATHLLKSPYVRRCKYIQRSLRNEVRGIVPCSAVTGSSSSYISFTISGKYVVFYHTLCSQSKCKDWVDVLETGRHFWFVCLPIREWNLGMCFLSGYSRRGLRWLAHMLGLSEGLLFWFAPAGDGMEPAWSRSIQAPADPLELRSSPEMRRRGADLLFRGYSSPVDKKTIELCCWNRKTRPEQFTAYDLCELRSNDKRAGR